MRGAAIDTSVVLITDWRTAFGVDVPSQWTTCTFGRDLLVREGDWLTDLGYWADPDPVQLEDHSWRVFFGPSNPVEAQMRYVDGDRWDGCAGWEGMPALGVVVGPIGPHFIDAPHEVGDHIPSFVQTWGERLVLPAPGEVRRWFVPGWGT